MNHCMLNLAAKRTCSAFGYGGMCLLRSEFRQSTWMLRRQKSSSSAVNFRKSVNIPGVTIVHDKATAKRALEELHRLSDRVHAWDTEAAEVGGIARADLRSPVTHGRVVCATCFCGEDADFGNGPRLFIDNDGPAAGLLKKEFKQYFENLKLKKVFHNYSFDRHLLAREGLRVRGYHADTLHMARFFDTSLASWEGAAQKAMKKDQHKKDQPLVQPKLGSPAATLSQHAIVRNITLGGITLERKAWSAGASMLHTSVIDDREDAVVPSGYGLKNLATFFGLADKNQKDFRQLFGTSAIAAEEAHNCAKSFPSWAQYATDDAVLTHRLYDHLHEQLAKRPWHSEVHKRSNLELLRDKSVARELAKKGRSLFTAQNQTGRSMWNFFEVYMRDFGESLADLEEVGIGVDCGQLARIEKEATSDAKTKQAEFVRGLSEAKGPDGEALVMDAQLINIASSQQLQTLLFGGYGKNSKTGDVLKEMRSFDVPKGHEGEKPTKRKFELKGLGLSPVPKRANFTATGNPKASGDILQEFAGASSDRPGLAYQQLEAKGFAAEQAELVVGALRDLQQAKRAKTFVTGFARPMLEFGKHAGRIHPEWKFDTATGRLACRRPNLQNIPAGRNDLYSIRSAFKASPGNSFVIADYSQLEMRILAHMSNCTTMIQKLAKNGDYHSEVTAEMFEHVADAIARGEVIVDEAHSTSTILPTIKEKFSGERQQAKAINFAIIYGKEATTLGEDLHISTPEAEALVDSWYRSKPEVKKWREEVLHQCRQSGCALSMLGRVRNLPLLDHVAYRGRSQRAAVNYVIQGSAADVVLAAMLRIWQSEKLKELGFRLVLQVHDEFVLEGPEKGASEAAELLQQLMMEPFRNHQPNFKFRVPLTSDVVIGSSFSKA